MHIHQINVKRKKQQAISGPKVSIGLAFLNGLSFTIYILLESFSAASNIAQNVLCYWQIIYVYVDWHCINCMNRNDVQCISELTPCFLFLLFSFLTCKRILLFPRWEERGDAWETQYQINVLLKDNTYVFVLRAFVLTVTPAYLDYHVKIWDHQ